MISWFFFWTLEALNCRLDCRILNSASAVIGRRWKTSGQIYKQILIKKKITRNSLKAFLCAEEGFKVWTALSLFSVNCKRSLPTPFCEFWHVTVPFNIGMRTRRIRPIMRRITLTLTRKKPTYHKHSHMSLRLCRMLEWTFMHLFANGLYKWFRRVCGLAAT